MECNVVEKYFLDCVLGFRMEFVECGKCGIKIGSDVICK